MCKFGVIWTSRSTSRSCNGDRYFFPRATLLGDTLEGEAYRSKDQLMLGRLWHNRITGTPEDQITNDQAMTSYQEWAAIVEKLEREI
jgi:hypothetical protein